MDSPVKQRTRLFSLGGKATIGVDISTTQLVCVKVRGQNSGFEVLGTTIMPLPEGAGPGTPEFVEQLRQALSQLCAPGEHPIIWAASQDATTSILYVTLPKVSSRQVDNAVFWIAKQKMGFDEGVDVFDFERRDEIVEKGAPRLGALAYTANRETVRRLREDFTEAGYPLHGLTMPAFSHQNLFRRHLLPDQGGAAAVLHVGPDWSRLEIGSCKDLMLARGIKTSMAGMEQAILETLASYGAGRMSSTSATPLLPAPGTGSSPLTDVRPEDARELLRALFGGGESLADANPGKYLDEVGIMAMVEPVALRLVRQVAMTIKHFREAFGFEEVTRIMVSGPLGASRRFVTFIGEQLGIPCVPLDPLGDAVARGRKMPEFAAPGPVYAQALGLALADISITPNILFTCREKAGLRAARRLEQAALAGLALVLVGLALLSFNIRLSAKSLEDARTQAVRELDSLGGKPDLAALAARVAALKTRRDASKLFLDRIRASAVWGAVLDLAPEGVAVGTLSAEFSPPRDLAKKQAKDAAVKEKPEVPGRLALSGVVTGDPLLFDSRLASFVMALEQSPLVGSATVKTEGQEVLDGGVTGMRFTVSIVLAEKAQ